MIPRPILDRLNIAPTLRRRLQLANGQIIEREAGQVLITVDGETLITLCIFGDPGSTPLLGAVTLEECSLAPDPVRQRLVPVIALLAAASCDAARRLASQPLHRLLLKAPVDHRL